MALAWLIVIILPQATMVGSRMGTGAQDGLVGRPLEIEAWRHRQPFAPTWSLRTKPREKPKMARSQLNHTLWLLCPF